MPSDPTITPPPTDTPDIPIVETAKVHFSGPRWFFTGIVRILYRFWTRIAARLFPEDSWTERLAQVLHIPLPDRLNMTWITDQLAVGGRIRPRMWWIHAQNMLMTPRRWPTCTSSYYLYPPLIHTH